LNHLSKIFLRSLISLFITLIFTQTVHDNVVINSLDNPCTNAPLITEENLGWKVIYLTFDDGPSAITNKVLDILKEKNIKATFFLIGNQIEGFEDTVKRMHKEGHGIGLHTYTHKFKHIYRNNDNFIKEMNDCRNEILIITGTNKNIIW
jgi:peptidoglycan/xylan/chitin deacetylase (PgdA/CDA1 family)